MSTNTSFSTTPKSRHFFAGLLCAVLLCGCASRYDVSLTNGQQLTNIRKPTLSKNGGYYYYVDARGRTQTISSARVVEIGPHKHVKSTEPQ